MDTITKYKIRSSDVSYLSKEQVKFISEHSELFLSVDDSKLCENCEYLYFDSAQNRENRFKFHSVDHGDLFFDFKEQIDYHRKKNYSLSKEPLAKALGLTVKRDRIVWDVTCGTAKDALLIYSFGAKVVAFERHPIIYFLLLDAKERFPVNIQFIYGDSSQINLTQLSRPDTIYYDPMYPEKKKSALPRKEMQIFKEIVGPDTDSESYLEFARTIALDRVVVKRSLQAPQIKADINAVYEGKTTRYDMYKIFSK